MSVLIIGESFSENLGDQAIYEGFKNHFIDADVEVIRLDLSGRKRLNKSYNPHSKKKYSIKQFLSSSRLIKKSANVLFRFRNITRSILLIFRDFQDIKRKILKSDLVIFGGGSLLIDNNSSFPIKLFLHALICKAYKKKYVVAGCSARKISNLLSKWLIKSFLNGTSKIGVRDLHSSIVLKELGFDSVLLSDPALLLQPYNKKLISNKRPNLAINVMSKQMHGEFGDNAIFKEYISFINQVVFLYKDSYDITLFTTGSPDDIEFVDSSYTDTISIFHCVNVSDLLLFLSKQDKVIGTRLHSSILSISQNIIPFGVAWDTKVEGFFLTYDLGDLYLKLNSLSVENRCLNVYLSTEEQSFNKTLLKLKQEIRKDYKRFFKSLC